MRSYDLSLCLLFVLVTVGCASRTFSDLGNGVGVSPTVIDEYAREHDLSRKEARRQLRLKSDLERVNRFAEEHGITEAEAAKQRRHAEHWNLDSP